MGTPELIMPLRRGATQVSHSSGPAIESQTPESFLTAPPVSGSSRSQGQILREISGSHVVPVNPACLPSRHHTSIHKSRSPRALHVPDRTTLPPAIHICMGRSEGGDSELWAVLTGLRRPPWTLFPHHPALGPQYRSHDFLDPSLSSHPKKPRLPGDPSLISSNLQKATLPVNYLLCPQPHQHPHTIRCFLFSITLTITQPYRVEQK